MDDLDVLLLTLVNVPSPLRSRGLLYHPRLLNRRLSVSAPSIFSIAKKKNLTLDIHQHQHQNQNLFKPTQSSYHRIYQLPGVSLSLLMHTVCDSHQKRPCKTLSELFRLFFLSSLLLYLFISFQNGSLSLSSFFPSFNLYHRYFFRIR